MLSDDVASRPSTDHRLVQVRRLYWLLSAGRSVVNDSTSRGRHKVLSGAGGNTQLLRRAISSYLKS